jgi:NAD-dependent deacetylase
VVELHGLLEAFRCLDAGHPCDAGGIGHLAVPPDGRVAPPPCPRCGSPIRPGVVWFGEALPDDALRAGWAALEGCDSLLVVGTSSLVYPAAQLPSLALERGCAVIEINPAETSLTSRAAVSWRARAGEALPALASRLAPSTYSS